MSLHDGLPWLGRGRWIELGNSESAQYACGALSAAGDRALGGSIAEIDFDNAHGFEGGEGLGRGEIKTSGLEFLFDGAMEQECQRGDEDVRLHAIVGAVVDRPQVDDCP